MAIRRKTNRRSMLDAMAQAMAKADRADFAQERMRYRALARAALHPLQRPSRAVVEAAHSKAEFDAPWVINTNGDFSRAVRGMLDGILNDRDVHPGREEDD